MIKHRKRNRLQNHNYSQDGWYFVTICAKNREEFFGAVKNEEMILNEYGKIVKNQWLWIENQYEYVKLDEFIVMPNHLHGILIIENFDNGRDRLDDSCRDRSDDSCRDRSRPVPTGKIKSLSGLIGAFKTTSSKLIHQNGLHHFLWQRSFYDQIIRDEKSLDNIRQYIKNNSLKWALDRNHKQNLYY